MLDFCFLSINVFHLKFDRSCLSENHLKFVDKWDKDELRGRGVIGLRQYYSDLDESEFKMMNGDVGQIQKIGTIDAFVEQLDKTILIIPIAANPNLSVYILPGNACPFARLDFLPIAGGSYVECSFNFNGEELTIFAPDSDTAKPACAALFYLLSKSNVRVVESETGCLDVGVRRVKFPLPEEPLNLPRPFTLTLSKSIIEDEQGPNLVKNFNKIVLEDTKLCGDKFVSAIDQDSETVFEFQQAFVDVDEEPMKFLVKQDFVKLILTGMVQ